MKRMISVLLSIALLGVPAASFAQSASTGADPLVAETAYGKVKGSVQDGVISFKGVPFAAPPIGKLRFAPPQPLEAWEGVKECTKFKDSALQAKQTAGLTYSEDCLYLNIWQPEAQPNEPMPVLVFIHGGAYTQGSPNMPLYDGTRFASEGVVQVNIGYRLNGLGFMPSEELLDENGYLGNAGTLDQIAGLKWVQENIASFGGDPSNVTICGESAGSDSVSNMLVSPLAKGLFSKAIMESGNVLGQPLTSPLSTGNVEQALDNTGRLMKSVYVGNLEEMREIDAQIIADKSAFSLEILKPNDKAFFPIFDGKVLPKDPYAAVQKGEMNAVPILAGYNTDEGSIFIDADITQQEYETYVKNIFGDNADKVLKRYPVDTEHTPADRARFFMKMGLRMGSDIMADKLSEMGNDVYMYHFDYSVPRLVKAGVGTPHALELLFVFDTFTEDMKLDADARAFVDQVHNRWLNFIKNGDPNEGIAFETKWEKYTASGKETMVLDDESHMAPSEETEDIAFIASLIWGG